MYKAPQLGRVKSRLAKTIGDEAALELYRWMGRRQLESIPSNWEVEVRYSPDPQESLVRTWLGSRPRLEAQGKGDLGKRMLRAAESCLSDGVGRKAIFLGADCVDTDKDVLREAEARLNHADFVLGPASDGGYYLLGMKALEPTLFERIDWGTESVLEVTIERIQKSNRSMELLAERVDVDDWEDLSRVRGQIDEGLWKRLALR